MKPDPATQSLSVEFYVAVVATAYKLVYFIDCSLHGIICRYNIAYNTAWYNITQYGKQFVRLKITTTHALLCTAVVKH